MEGETEAQRGNVRPQKQCRALFLLSRDRAGRGQFPAFAPITAPTQAQDRKTVARTALLEGGGGASPNHGQDFSEFTVEGGEGRLGEPPGPAAVGREGALGGPHLWPYGRGPTLLPAPTSLSLQPTSPPATYGETGGDPCTPRL